jgi:hypothetical protein
MKKLWDYIFIGIGILFICASISAGYRIIAWPFEVELKLQDMKFKIEDLQFQVNNLKSK